MSDKKEVQFTSREKLILELGFEGPYNKPEHYALKSIIDVMPWILDVAEHKFNPLIARACIKASAQVIQAQEYVQRVIEEEEAKENKGSQT